MVGLDHFRTRPPKSLSDAGSLGPIRQFVRHHVESVTVLPLRLIERELDTERGYLQVTNSFEHDQRCDPYYGGSLDAWYEEDWRLFTRNAAGIASEWFLKDQMSLLSLMRMTEEGNGSGFLAAGEFSFDFIVKIATEGVCQPQGRKLRQMSIMIYQFPVGFALPPVRRRSVVPTNRAQKAVPVFA